MKKFRKRDSRIGVDVGSKLIKAVQLEYTAAGRRIRAALSQVRATSEVVPSQGEIIKLADTLDRQGFGGNQIVLAVPADQLLNSVLELPPRTSNAPLNQIARVELARAHKCAPDALEMSCWDLPMPARATKATHVMAVGCSHDHANSLLDAFENCGFEVSALSAIPCALATACSPLAAPKGEITALLDMGWHSTLLVLLYENAVVFTRKIDDAAMSKLHDALVARCRMENEIIDYLLGEVGFQSGPATSSSGLKLPSDALTLMTAHHEATANELTASFSYAAHQYPSAPVSRLLLAGGGAGIPGLDQYFSSTVGVITKVVRPIDLAECPVAISAITSSPTLSAALGLAQTMED